MGELPRGELRPLEVRPHRGDAARQLDDPGCRRARDGVASSAGRVAQANARVPVGLEAQLVAEGLGAPLVLLGPAQGEGEGEGEGWGWGWGWVIF